MKLPNAEQVVVEREKVLNYLLKATHPDNGGKAEFFEGLGFRRAEWPALVTALCVMAGAADVTQSTASPHGQKYVTVGRLEAPGGQSAMVQAVWIVDKGLEAARLVTVYPWKARATDD